MYTFNTHNTKNTAYKMCLLTIPLKIFKINLLKLYYRQFLPIFFEFKLQNGLIIESLQYECKK